MSTSQLGKKIRKKGGEKTMTNKIMAIALVVSSLERAIDFYQNKLGLKISRADNGYAELATECAVLELMTKETLPNKIQALISNKSQPKAYYAFAQVEDVDVLYKELKEKGVEFIARPQTMPWGQRAAYFTDPDGNIWEISQWVKQN
ncbi:MAG: glyoxalase [Patescibacteria group bacterium]|nr:MAG: glyoxalase [Patescibacteria group bacterium]